MIGYLLQFVKLVKELELTSQHNQFFTRFYPFYFFNNITIILSSVILEIFSSPAGSNHVKKITIVQKAN